VSLTKKIFHGMIWSMLERILSQAVQFSFGVVLARILSPSEYGLMGILLVIIAFLQVFVDFGYSKALVQKQDRTQVDISSIFYFNVWVGILLYGIIYFAAPSIAEFYQNAEIVNLIRVLALIMPINAIFSIPQTLLSLKFEFKTITKVNIISISLSGACGVYFAYEGYGVWALVFQSIIKSVSLMMLMWYFVKWKPLLEFSLLSLKSMFGYGSKILIGAVLNIFINNVSNLYIAKYFSTKNLGFYTRGTQFVDVLYGTFSSVIDSVLFPSFSSIQTEKSRLIFLTKSTIRSVSLITMPFFFGLAILAKPIVISLLTEKWLEAVPILQLFCFARLITLISGVNVNLIYSIGRSDLILKQQYVKLIVRVLFILIAIRYGIIAVAIAEVLSTMVHFFINTYYPGKFLSYGPFKQIKDCLPILFASLIMTISIYTATFLIDNNYLKIILSVLVGILVYFPILHFLKTPELYLLKEKALDFLSQSQNEK
jgi:O-antigen/teichoic acid export membrane protein